MRQNYTIPVDEALKLRDKQDLDELYAAADLHDAICKVTDGPVLAIAALYNVAFIAGVRSERARRSKE